VLMARLQDATIKGERRNESLDLEGWLELAWNPSPLLFVAGMNEGFVPDGHVGDVFLPDSVRSKLGLRDDKLRVARDACLLTALIAQRRTGGRLILLVGKTSTAGDPLRPSRLLFRCTDKELVARAQLLFRNPAPAHAAEAFTVSFQLDPALVPADGINRKISRQLRATSFRDYLACPLRFYLHHVLGMRAQDDCAREPGASGFGTMVHAALAEMGQDKKLWACDDKEVLARWLEDRLRSLVCTRYGVRPWLGVELTIDSAVQRLRAFAQKQVEWHKAGWEILSSECEAEKIMQLNDFTVVGHIDRIDQNAGTRQVCVLDYKTTDTARTPAAVHIGPKRDEPDLVGAGIPLELVTGGTTRPAADKPSATKKKLSPEKPEPVEEKRSKSWVDLQLPLYRELVRPKFGPDVQLGYICLPISSGDTGFKLWEGYGDTLHASAIACAEAVARGIKDGRFWPSKILKAGYDDDLAGVLLDDPDKSICRPVSPWGDGT
ncbi:MAG: PD-(D/E)XK nuclease family protein, partial [bacterium]